MAFRTEPKIKSVDIEKIRKDLSHPIPRLSLPTIVGLVAALLVLSWGLRGTEARPDRFIKGVPALVNFVTGLFPPEFELSDGTERAITVPNFSVRSIERTPKATRAQKASADDIAAMVEGQTLLYVLQETSTSVKQILSADEATNYSRDDVKSLRAYVVDPGMTIALDEWDESVMIVEAGYRVKNAVPYLDGQYVVAKRYVLEKDEFLLGYPIILDSIIETIQIAIIGTLGAILIALPFALLAARNISPHPLIYQTTRLFLNINRSIPTLIWALIMVSAVGLGPFAGVLALIVGSIGSTAKLYAESFEQIDPDQVAALRATGANPMHVFNFGVLPQAFPLLATYSLISFEHNIRDSTILGIVGAGGVGFIIQKYTALFQFQRLMGAVIIIAILVTLIDRVSDFVRKRII